MSTSTIAETSRDDKDESWAENLVLLATQNGFAADRDNYNGHSVYKELDDVTKERYRRELRVWDT